jgi:hypothetical protein
MTRWRVASGILTFVRPFSTTDTVVRDTPASVATSALVGRVRIAAGHSSTLTPRHRPWSTNARQ